MQTMPVDIDIARYIQVSVYDTLTTDIQESDLVDIGNELGRANLQQVHVDPRVQEAVFPSQGVTGIFHGTNQRLFVALPVRKRGRAVWVLFLVDTGAPFTYLRADAFDALGYETIPHTTDVHVFGTPLPVSVSTNHFSNVNLLGQDAMATMRLTLHIDYVRRTVRLHRSAACP